jgi:hypothetical protein
VLLSSTALFVQTRFLFSSRARDPARRGFICYLLFAICHSLRR